MNKNQILKNLKDFVKIQSVSTDSSRFSEILQAAEFLQQKLTHLSFETSLLKKKNLPPLLIGTRIINPRMKTIGIYGHYDVQPEDPVDEWKSSPFETSLKNGKIYGRGVADNKGHIIQNLAAIEDLLIIKKLRNNIVFIIEGEEETGSLHFEEYLKRVVNILSKVDVFYITDMGMHQKNIPEIFYALRGLVYFELMIKMGERDLHSGIYGNRVINPAQALSSLLAKMKNAETGKITIPHFYDQVKKISLDELKLLQATVRDIEIEKKEAGVYKILGMDNIHPSLVTKIYPSLDISGLYSGYIKEGTKTIIPSYALAKFSCRLVEHQDINQVIQLVGNFIKTNLPDGVKYELKILSKESWFYIDREDVYIKKTGRILNQIFGHQTLFNRSGGSVAAAGILQSLYKKPVVLTGFTLPDDNIHSSNENFDEEMFWRGIEALKMIYCQ